MAHEKATESITARVPQQMREAFERLAEKRHLKSSDLVREALREYLATTEVKKDLAEIDPAQQELIARGIA